LHQLIGTLGCTHPLLPAVAVIAICAFCLIPALLLLPAVAAIDWDTWLHSPGMPPVANSYDTSMASAAYDLAVEWHTADVMGIGADAPPGVGPDDIQGWSSAQVRQ
jgi:hypothetical protein